ncbi:hypothetical protein N7497_004794 [Penicillium chrysogenum]|nr:hypothetical protein N7497_004794 [Penicillium chrysogenum]
MGKVSGIVPLSVLAVHDRGSEFPAEEKKKKKKKKKKDFCDGFSKMLGLDKLLPPQGSKWVYFSNPLVR